MFGMRSKKERQMARIKEANKLELVSSREVAARAAELGRPIPKGKPAPLIPHATDTDCPASQYASWDVYVAGVADVDIRKWCRTKANGANKERFMSGKPDQLVTAEQVYAILVSTQGRCYYCHSLCVEKRPSKTNGGPAPWGHMGRRIGSLGHKLGRVNGGGNATDNLCWSCLWCNTWPSERTPGATDHGGIQE
jgi:hypothetical protein